MFIVEYNGWRLERANTLTDKCVHCGNTGEHFVYVVPKGLQVGVIFRKKPLLGARSYFLACPTCGYLAKELSAAQAQAMRS